MPLDHWLFRCIQTMDDPRMNLVPKTDAEKLKMIRYAFDDYRKKAAVLAKADEHPPARWRQQFTNNKG